MAKKKEIVVNPKNAPAEAPTGNVVVLYGHTAIAGVSEAAAIRCETENTICVKDISVEYDPPEPAAVGALINLTDTAETYHDFGYHSKNYIIGDAGYGYIAADFANGNRILPRYIESVYVITLYVTCSTDALNVTVNGNVVAFDAERERYICDISAEDYPSAITLTIADKSNGK